MATFSIISPKPVSVRDSMYSWPWAPFTLAILVVYILVVRASRYRRINGMIKQYGYTTREQLAKMTDSEAFEIVTQMSKLEFPSTFEKSLQLGLFRTYGIPSISRLLVETAQLSKSVHVAKRYADTQAIFGEIIGNAPTSERAIDSYARLNYLHGHYIKSGKITNDDMLCTLSFFMTHPVEWTNRVEWRRLTDLEVCAMGVFYKGMGDAMEIDFAKLPGAGKGFRDGLHFFEELDTWAKGYEAEFMVPHVDNYTTAIPTINLLLTTIPRAAHGPAKNIIHAAMDDRLRHAVMFEDPVRPYNALLTGFLVVRKYYLRYLAMPRLKKDPLVSEQASGSGRLTFRRYETVPIYVKPTVWNRWGPAAWLNRLMGLPLPGDPGMMHEGFRTQDCGPRAFLGKGAKESDATKEKLKRQGMGSCPFAMR